MKTSALSGPWNETTHPNWPVSCVPICNGGRPLIRLDRAAVAAIVSILIFSGLLVPHAVRAAEPPEPVVALPQVVVTDSRLAARPEAWRHAQLAGWEILSSASEKNTARLGTEFEFFAKAVRLVWPKAPRPTTPGILVVCGRERDFAQFVPGPNGVRRDANRASLLLRDAARDVIVVDLAANELHSPGAELFESDSGAARRAVDPVRELRRLYLQYLLHATELRLPPWFEEGLSQVLLRLRVDSDLIEFGSIEDNPPGDRAGTGFGPERESGEATDPGAAQDPVPAAADPAPVPPEAVAERDFNVFFARRGLMPLSRLFTAGHDGSGALAPAEVEAWSQQAYAFVHLCLFGQKGRWKPGFLKFLERSSTAPATEALFTECFGVSYHAMEMELRGYIGYARYQAEEIRAKRGSAPLLVASPLGIREATPAEVGRIKGVAKWLAGDLAAARAELNAPYLRQQADPALLATLGQLELARGAGERARSLLAAAAEQHATDPCAYLALARVAFADAAKAAGVAGRFSAAQVEAVAGPLRQARALPPVMPATYELLAQTWRQSAGPITRDDAAFLVEGVRQFPRDFGLAADAADVFGAAGRRELARWTAMRALASAPDADARTRVSRWLKE